MPAQVSTLEGSVSISPRLDPNFLSLASLLSAPAGRNQLAVPPLALASIGSRGAGIKGGRHGSGWKTFTPEANAGMKERVPRLRLRSSNPSSVEHNQVCFWNDTKPISCPLLFLPLMRAGFPSFFRLRMRTLSPTRLHTCAAFVLRNRRIRVGGVCSVDEHSLSSTSSPPF